MKSKRVAIYARVSTDQQTTDQQVNELRAVAKRHDWHIVREYVDNGISGTKVKRPQLDAMLKAAARREFDLVAAWSVDRLGRSLTHLLSLLGELHSKGIDLYLHLQSLDTSTPSGRAMFQMCGVFAEFERAMIVERVRSGMNRAAKQGTRSGNPIGRPAVGAAVERRVRALHRKGMGMLAIGRKLGIGSGTVQRILREQ